MMNATSTPTITMMLDRFEHKYQGFRNELRPREKRTFDNLVQRARQHATAINRRPDMDFDRVVTLALVMALGGELERTKEELREVQHALSMASGRIPYHSREELVRMGQTRLPHT